MDNVLRGVPYRMQKRWSRDVADRRRRAPPSHAPSCSPCPAPARRASEPSAPKHRRNPPATMTPHEHCSPGLRSPRESVPGRGSLRFSASTTCSPTESPIVDERYGPFKRVSRASQRVVGSVRIYRASLDETELQRPGPGQSRKPKAPGSTFRSVPSEKCTVRSLRRALYET